MQPTVTFTVNVNLVLREAKGEKPQPDSSQGGSENPADLVRSKKNMMQSP